jgi:hypothetical protein
MEKFRSQLGALLFVWITSVSCEGVDNATSLDEAVFDDVLYQALDSLNEKHDLDEKVIVFFNRHPDKVKTTVVANTVKELEGDSSIQALLIRRLNENIDNPLENLDLTIENTSYDLITNQKQVIEIIEKNKPSIAINLSRVALNNEMDRGVFYLGLQCGANCSAGYLVFTKMNQSRWDIAAIIPRWHS